MNGFYKERLSALKTKTIGKLLVFLTYQQQIVNNFRPKSIDTSKKGCNFAPS